MSFGRKLAILGTMFTVVAIATVATVAAAATRQEPTVGKNGAAQTNITQPQINWDKPIQGGIASSALGARTAGQLPFAPTLPRFGLQPKLIEVTNTSSTAPNGRAIAYVYRFPLGPVFQGDGRVRVLEYKTKVTESQLEAVAANPPGPSADFRIIRVNGHGALLVQGNGVGRVQYILEGIMYDVTGPAISSAEAERLAAEI
ncbi:MAG: hypothetical protein JWM19_2989 [Actinomycetia bacterium]|nr:hypothetical protein [Actinomycetes bacterium]